MCAVLFVVREGFRENRDPLSEQLKSRTSTNKRIVWTQDMLLAFNRLKDELLSNVVLDIADPSKPFIFEVDASDLAVGGVLSQQDEAGNLRPVGFFSRKLEGTPVKARWDGSSMRRRRTQSYSSSRSTGVGWRRHWSKSKF